MTLVLDASALVAMMRGEPEANDLERHVIRAAHCVTNGIALWETSRAISRLIKQPDDVALAEVRRFCALLGVETILIGEREAGEAVLAQQRYGKGSGHPAKLNMGDCFAYACAKTNGAKLLYKGADFAKTDLA